MQFYHTKISDVKVSADLEAKELKKMYDEGKIGKDELLKSIFFYLNVTDDLIQHIEAKDKEVD
jgi:hypothetical protein